MYTLCSLDPPVRVVNYTKFYSLLHTLCSLTHRYGLSTTLNSMYWLGSYNDWTDVTAGKFSVRNVYCKL